MTGPALTPEKSTNVRLAAFRAIFGGLSAIAPGIAARLAMALFRQPPRHRDSESERAALGRSERLDLLLDGKPLAAWRWGRGPAVLLVHGWGSRGSRLASFVAPLTEAGFSVVAFDAPGHGASAGRLSSLPQFISAVQAVARELGDRGGGCRPAGPVPATFSGIVAHSMGGAAATLAMSRGLTARRVVFLAPAADPAGYSERFAEMIGLTPGVLARMRRSIERRFGQSWDDFDVLRAAATMTAPLLVFHDRDDRDVAWTDGAAIAAAWPGSELVSTAGLGHRRIVHDLAVVARAVSFLAQSQGATRASSGA
jgi:pimeloyl-ACP methyl ester carboxylesterase